MKLLKFVKENKAIVFALVVVALAFGLLALPGQFAHWNPNGATEKIVTSYKDNLSGYQWMFGTYEPAYGSKEYPAFAQGISMFVLLVVSVPGLIFSKKSSFVSLLTSIVLVVLSILFFTSSVATVKAYDLQVWTKDVGGPRFYAVTWLPYVLGGLILLAGAALGYRTFKVMKSETGRPNQPKGPSYSYLHK